MRGKRLPHPLFLRAAAVIILIGIFAAACSPSGVSPTGAQQPVQNTSTAPAQSTNTVPVATNTSAPAVKDTPAAAPSATAAATTPSAAGAGSTAGGIKYVIVPEKSEASYKVREQLANVDLPSDAIGKTNKISGQVVVNADGTIDSAASKITVDVSSLQTDRSMRDNYVRRNILQADQYPNAVFVPNKVTGLPAQLPASGPVSFQVSGDLTIRNVTKPVTWNVTGTINGDQATGKATTSFKFEDFNLTQPRVPIVLSVENNITLEVTVTVQRSNG